METKPRITARVDEATQELLGYATALAGISSINAFVLNAAIEKANALIEREQIMKLNAKATKSVLASLDNPPEPNVALKALFKQFGAIDEYHRP